MRTDSGHDQQRVHVAPIRGGHGVFARTPVHADACILALAGIVVDAPNRRTLQLDADQHLDVPTGASDQEARASYPWRFLNHGCAPNSRIEDRRLIAVRSIAVGEEIQFDYNTTEWDMADAFACQCAAPGCTGAPVRGFRHLSRTEQAQRRPLLSAHLRNRLKAGAADS